MQDEGNFKQSHYLNPQLGKDITSITHEKDPKTKEHLEKTKKLNKKYDNRDE